MNHIHHVCYPFSLQIWFMIFVLVWLNQDPFYGIYLAFLAMKICVDTYNVVQLKMVSLMRKTTETEISFWFSVALTLLQYVYLVTLSESLTIVISISELVKAEFIISVSLVTINQLYIVAQNWYS